MNEIRIRFNGGFHNDVFYIEGKDKVVRISDYKKTKEMVLQEVERVKQKYNLENVEDKIKNEVPYAGNNDFSIYL